MEGCGNIHLFVVTSLHKGHLIFTEREAVIHVLNRHNKMNCEECGCARVAMFGE